MRKFILYFLLAMLAVAVATFFYGIWNANRIRVFAAELSVAKNNHNFSSQIEGIEQNFKESGQKDIAGIKDETNQLKGRLDVIIRESEAAKGEIEAAGAPKLAKPTKDLATDYFSKVNRQAADLKGMIGFMGQIIEVAAVFGEIGESASLEDMKVLIAKAKEKNSAVQAEILPPDVRESARNLKESMDMFLLKLEEVASLASQNTAQLDAAYADFSRKEEEFFSAGKKHIDGMENLDIMENRISSDLERLSKVKFSLK